MRSLTCCEWMACRLYALTPVSLQYTRALCCEWLTDYYLIHRRDAERCQRQVVNGLQIATINTWNEILSVSGLVVNGLQITTTYTQLSEYDNQRKLWMAYRLRPLTPTSLPLNTNVMLWIAYRLRPLTPAPWQWHRGCRLWMARRLLPDTPI